MPALIHFPLDERESNSRPGEWYRIKIRIDTRVVDREERVRSAILTCNCGGWKFSKETPKTCTHSRDDGAILTKFRKWQDEQSVRARRGAEILGPDDISQEVTQLDSPQPYQSPAPANEMGGAFAFVTPAKEKKKKARK